MGVHVMNAREILAEDVEKVKYGQRQRALFQIIILRIPNLFTMKCAQSATLVACVPMSCLT